MCWRGSATDGIKIAEGWGAGVLRVSSLVQHFTNIMRMVIDPTDMGRSFTSDEVLNPSWGLPFEAVRNPILK